MPEMALIAMTASTAVKKEATHGLPPYDRTRYIENGTILVRSSLPFRC
jgi:hypothetical protein